MKNTNLPLADAAAPTEPSASPEKSHLHIHVKSGKQISSIREKSNCYNIQVDEQLKMKIYSDAAIESRIYSFQGCLRETKDTSCLTFPESQNQHVGFIMAHIILKKKKA